MLSPAFLQMPAAFAAPLRELFYIFFALIKSFLESLEPFFKKGSKRGTGRSPVYIPRSAGQSLAYTHRGARQRPVYIPRSARQRLAYA